ncbi:MAG TPA: hypothetical protein VK879_12900 [Candidatus Sulfomarinibacteraceae bacterium]|nr:hypothetical protein [Candidatus Sulfomarinibacteraceae bacterium]
MIRQNGDNAGRDAADVQLARAVRDACARAALAAYEGAAMDGLCHEGAWEVAVGAIRVLDVERIVDEVTRRTARGRATEQGPGTGWGVSGRGD